MKASGLRIALVGPLPPPSGGMANQTLQLATLLRSEGATVEVIQVNRPYQPPQIGKIKGIRALFRLLPYLQQLWQTADKVDLYHVMANSGWSWHLFAAPAIWIARMKGKPVLVNYRGGEAASFFAKAFFWVRPSLARTSAIVVPSGFLEAVFAKRGFATCIVPNIIDLSRFSAGDIQGTSWKADAPHILVARNLESIYDNATALRAFAIIKQTLPAARLTIAGSGPQRQMLESLASELALADAVTFTGRVDNAGMGVLYQRSDVMLNPSLADNMPISVLEALASGVPVVTTDVGGVPYLVEHEKTALLVPPQNPVAMAAATLSLLNDCAKAGRVRSAGLESVQQYTWPNVRDRLLLAYSHALMRQDQPILDQQ